ncbi:MAG: hypothetical protein HKN87_10095 [Saprospiraceae bacterium]|nr:hypothetical protein [Saprospiraceae bacterium]
MKTLTKPIFLCGLGLIMLLLIGEVDAASSDAIADLPPAPHIVFLISKDENNYEAHRTIPKFARQLQKRWGYETSVLLGKGPRTAYAFSDMEVIKRADVLVVFCRRLALQPDQLEYIRDHLNEGKPLVGIRTANHAFSLRDTIEPGFLDWWDFVPDVLGCINQGYGPVDPGTAVKVVSKNEAHPILKNLPSQWHSQGNVYKVEMVDNQALILLQGSFGDHTEPIAWVREMDQGSEVFYTSLGYPKDFSDDHFRTLLINAFQYLLEK